MVLLLTDVFLLLTQVLLWLVVGLVAWFVLLKALPKAILSTLVLLLILLILALSFFQGPPAPNSGIIDILWRLISFPFSPLGLGLLLLLILFFNTKLSKVVKNVITTVLVLLLLGCFPIVAYYLAQELEMEAIELIRAQPALTGDARRVIVLLGQDTTRLQPRPRREAAPTATPAPATGTPAPTATPQKVERPVTTEAFQVLSQLPTQITEHGDRIIYAAQLYKEEATAGTRPLILISASERPDRKRRSGETGDDVSEARDIQTMLTRTFGVPETDIRLDSNGTDIHRSAENVRQLLTGTQRVNFGNQITLVGTAINMNRAALTFAQIFDDSTITVRPTDFYTVPAADRMRRLVQGRDLIEHQILVTDLIPSVEALSISTHVIEEYLNALYYFLRGWIKIGGVPSLSAPRTAQIEQPNWLPLASIERPGAGFNSDG